MHAKGFRRKGDFSSQPRRASQVAPNLPRVASLREDILDTIARISPYSSLMFDSLITLPHLMISARTNAPNSSGPSPPIS